MSGKKMMYICNLSLVGCAVHFSEEYVKIMMLIIVIIILSFSGLSF